ncbi:TRAFAC class myosin-kinesin ATPase superfamily protein [Cryptotrichosporon argae]
MDNNDRSTTRYDSYDFDHVVAELVANYGKGDPYWVSPGVHLILFANPHPRGVAEAEAKMTKNASKCALPADNQVFSDAELENAITALVDEYRRMPQDMYIVLKGPSGTGKTVLLGKITKLLSTLLPSNGSCAVEDNLKDVIEALGTFGNAATASNHNSSRFGIELEHIDTATRSDIVWKTLLAVAALRIACDEREAVTSQAVDYWLAVAGEKLGITAVLVKAAKYRFPDGSAGTRSLREIRSWAKDLCLDLYSVIFEVSFVRLQTVSRL